MVYYEKLRWVRATAIVLMILCAIAAAVLEC